MRRVVVKVEVGGGGAADVGVAADRVVFDGFGRVEREEREGRAGGSFGALHLQDCFLMAYVCECGMGVIWERGGGRDCLFSGA